MPTGHGYCGIVEEVGSAVRFVEPGQFQPDNPEVVVTAYEGGNQHPRRSERHDLREPVRKHRGRRGGSVRRRQGDLKRVVAVDRPLEKSCGSSIEHGRNRELRETRTRSTGLAR
jgi:hypothetical protein